MALRPSTTTILLAKNASDRSKSPSSRFLTTTAHQDRILGRNLGSVEQPQVGDLARNEEILIRGFDPREEIESSQEYVTRIPVTREKYIQISKIELVRSLAQGLDRSGPDFLTICSCLESILHAEHKSLLEELRVDSSRQAKNSIPKNDENGRSTSRRTLSRFQQNIMRVLKRAQFQELSARDLQLTTALNSDYLLTLPIDIDWKRTSSANLIIFRRGFATEKQEGFLFGAKLDYLQALILRGVFNLFAQPLLKTFQLKRPELENAWTESLRKWLEEPLRPDELFEDQIDHLPVWAAAQRAVPRYEAVLSSAGSRGKLLKRFLSWLRILPPEKTNLTSLFNDSSPPSLRPSYLTRISMRDIWLPALECHARISVWKRLQNAFSVFFSRSTLQEPAFKELVVMHASQDRVDDANHLRLELNTYRNIPVPDLKVLKRLLQMERFCFLVLQVVFPNKKLNFRLLDTVRLDITTIAGLLAFLVNYRFDNILSSPSAFILDIVAAVSLLVFVTRACLGYKQTWDRYELLVNKTLYEKTLASAFGVVHFLIDASAEQQFKQAILLYGMLLKKSTLSQALSSSAFQGDVSLARLGSICERYIYGKFKQQIEMPVTEAVETLSRMGLVTLHSRADEIFIQAVPQNEAIYSLETRWRNLLTDDHGRWRA